MAKKISQEVLDLEQRIKGVIKIDKTGIVSNTEGLYTELMPEGLDAETVEKVRKYDSNLLAAGALALGNVTNPVMKKNADVTEVTMNIPMTGKDQMSFTYSRVVQTPKIEDGKRVGNTDKFGYVVPKIALYGARRDVGNLSAVKEHLSAAAADAFGS